MHGQCPRSLDRKLDKPTNHFFIDLLFSLVESVFDVFPYLTFQSMHRPVFKSDADIVLFYGVYYGKSPVHPSFVLVILKKYDLFILLNCKIEVGGQ